MKSETLIAAAVAGVAMVGSAAAQPNLLVNSSFEEPVTADGAPFVGFWEAFSSGAPNTGAGNSTLNPLSGDQHVALNILGDDNSFAGVFQDVEGLVSGQEVTFSGFHAAPDALNVGVEFRIEFFDFSGEGSSQVLATPNETTAPAGATYEEFNLTTIVPDNATVARVVYAIQTFGGDGDEVSNSGTIFLDDLSFVVVPAPGAAAVLGVAGLGLARRRR